MNVCGVRTMEKQLLQFHVRWCKRLSLWPGKLTFIRAMHVCVMFVPLVLQAISSTGAILQCGSRLTCIFDAITYEVLMITCCYTFLVFLFHSKIYEEAIVTLHNLMEEFKTHEYTLKAEKFVHNVSILSFIYCTGGIIHYSIVPFVEYDGCMQRDPESNAFICGLPTPGWFPFDPNVAPYYQIAYVFQTYTASTCIYSVLTPAVLGGGIVYHIITHLRMICDKLQKISNEKPEERFGCLQRILKHHSHILEFSDVISSSFNTLMLMYALLMSLIFSFIGFQIIQMFVTNSVEFWFLSRYCILFCGWFLELVLLSLLGQLLIDESTAVGESAFNMEWYNESIAFQKMVLLMMLRSSKPLVLSSASLSDISLPSASKVMSTTYSYLTILYNVLIANEKN